MRLPYAPTTPPTPDPEVEAIYARVAARRAPRPLIPLDLALLHSPNIADGWNSFLGSVRTKSSLPDDIREIAICRVAVLNGATYEWSHHAPLAKAGGVSDAGIKILAQNKMYSVGDTDEALPERAWAVVRYTDAMTREVSVSEEVFAGLKSHFTDREVVEITATVRFRIRVIKLDGEIADYC